MTDEPTEVDYAERAAQRRRANHGGRTSSIPENERLKRQITILADRLALALHIMSDHEQFIRHSTTSAQMKHLEDWVEELLEEEPEVAEGRSRRFDYWRKVTRYGYLMSGIRTLLRVQVNNPPTIPRLGE